MKNLSGKHIDMLIEMVEIHFACFEKHYPEYDITYENVLELNHQKMINILDGCLECEDDILDFIFESMIDDYKRILTNERPNDEDEYYGSEDPYS